MLLTLRCPSSLHTVDLQQRAFPGLVQSATNRFSTVGNPMSSAHNTVPTAGDSIPSENLLNQGIHPFMANADRNMSPFLPMGH